MHKTAKNVLHFLVINILIYCFQRFIPIQCQNVPVNLPCTTKDGKLGSCVVLERCESIRVGLENRTLKHSMIKNCGFVHNDVKVCCPDILPTITPAPGSDSTSSPDVIIFPEETAPGEEPYDIPIRLGSRKADMACERWKSLQDVVLGFHIIDGEEATIGEFPHMAALGYEWQTFSNTSADWKCGGTLISETYVLTAAHCVADAKNPPILIRMGKVSLNSDEDAAMPIDAGVSEIILHPQYRTSLHYNDIALIRLNISVPFSAAVKPACLDTDSAEVSETLNLTVSGWGQFNESLSSRSSKLLKGTVMTVPTQMCNATYSQLDDRKLPQLLRVDQTCAGDSTMRQDTCQGDSGGPLQVVNRNNQPATLIGITSFGFFCATALPGIYTKVDSFLDWIEAIVWP